MAKVIGTNIKIKAKEFLFLNAIPVIPWPICHPLAILPPEPTRNPPIIIQRRL